MNEQNNYSIGFIGLGPLCTDPIVLFECEALSCHTVNYALEYPRSCLSDNREL